MPNPGPELVVDWHATVPAGTDTVENDGIDIKPELVSRADSLVEDVISDIQTEKLYRTLVESAGKDWLEEKALSDEAVQLLIREGMGRNIPDYLGHCFLYFDVIDNIQDRLWCSALRNAKGKPEQPVVFSAEEWAAMTFEERDLEPAPHHGSGPGILDEYIPKDGSFGECTGVPDVDIQRKWIGHIAAATLEVPALQMPNQILWRSEIATVHARPVLSRAT